MNGFQSINYEIMPATKVAGAVSATQDPRRKLRMSEECQLLKQYIITRDRVLSVVAQGID